MTNFSTIKHFLPSGPETLAQLLDPAQRSDLLSEPFSEDRLDILGSFSKTILSRLGRNAPPELAALASWLRPAHLREILRGHATPHTQRKNTILVPAGLVFHIAPANVDTMFVYSWALSYLCGNANIVRLPGARGPILDTLLDLLSTHADDHPALAQQNAFISYPHSDAISATISMQCSHRIVWGGDETVSRIRQIPLNPHASERSFASKYSIALLDAPAFLEASPQERSAIAARAYADIFPFDQLACSSPQLFFWLGNGQEFNAATEAFDQAIAAELHRRAHPADTATAIHRHNAAFEAAATQAATLQLGVQGFTSLRYKNIPSLDQRPTCGAGALSHTRLNAPTDLTSFIQPHDQTLTHWGLPIETLQTLAKTLGPRGLDRIVPLGQALSFSPLWDGHDLLNDLTRKLPVISE